MYFKLRSSEFYVSPEMLTKLAHIASWHAIMHLVAAAALDKLL